MSPWTDTDTDTDTGTARRAAIQVVLAESHRVLAELRNTLAVLDDIQLDPDSVDAGLDRALVDVERSRLPRSWDLVGLDADRAPVLADRTCGVWPRACGERWYLDESGVSRYYTCTRIASHTGRHAAGLAGAIVAVWEQDEPEVLGATGAAA